MTLNYITILIRVLQDQNLCDKQKILLGLIIGFGEKGLLMGNVALQNTHGLALEYSARYTNDPLRREGYFQDAEKIFGECITKEPTDPYNYIGQVFVLRQRNAIIKL